MEPGGATSRVARAAGSPAALPELGFAEVRYRVKSWRRLELCVDDARAADHGGSARRARPPRLLDGRRGLASRSRDEPTVEEVIGLAPWIPDQLDVTTLRGKRLTVIHGALDRWFPGSPGVSASHSAKGLRSRARARRGRPLRPHPRRAPRCRAAARGESSWRCRRPTAGAELVEEELRRFVSSPEASARRAAGSRPRLDIPQIERP